MSCQIIPLTANPKIGTHYKYRILKECETALKILTPKMITQCMKDHMFQRPQQIYVDKYMNACYYKVALTVVAVSCYLYKRPITKVCAVIMNGATLIWANLLPQSFFGSHRSSLRCDNMLSSQRGLPMPKYLWPFLLDALASLESELMVIDRSGYGH